MEPGVAHPTPQPPGSDRIAALELYCGDMAAVIADLGSRVNRAAQRARSIQQRHHSPTRPDAAAATMLANPDTADTVSVRSFGGKVWTKRAKGGPAGHTGEVQGGTEAVASADACPFDTLSELFSMERPLTPLTRRQIKVSVHLIVFFWSLVLYLESMAREGRVGKEGEVGCVRDRQF